MRCRKFNCTGVTTQHNLWILHSKIYNVIKWIDKWAAMFSFAFWNLHIFSVVQYVCWEFRAKYLEIGSGKIEHKSIALIIIIRSEFARWEMWDSVFKILGYSASSWKMGICYALFRDLWLCELKRILQLAIVANATNAFSWIIKTIQIQNERPEVMKRYYTFSIHLVHISRVRISVPT